MRNNLGFGGRMKELGRCPKCDGELDIKYYYQLPITKWFYVNCYKCGQITDLWDDYVELKKMWITRT